MEITLAAIQLTTGFSSTIRSSVFTDFAAHYCPVRKRAWLYKVNEPRRPILAEKGMEQAPTQQQVTNWVVDFLNGRLNEELAKLMEAA